MSEPQSDAPSSLNDHPMDLPVDPEAYVGRPLDEVPEISPGQHCNSRRWDRCEEEDEVVFAGYCQNRAGKGTNHVGEGRCKFHGGAADNTGESNGNYSHGAYTDKWADDPSRDPHEIVDELASKHSESPDEIARHIAAQLLLQMHRSHDPRFLARWEQYASEFLLAPDMDRI